MKLQIDFAKMNHCRNYRLREMSNEKKTLSNDDHKKVITYLVKSVDKQSLTHLNSVRVGYEQISKRIYGISRGDLLFYLEDPAGIGYKLIDELSRKTDPKDDGDSKIHGRSNLLLCRSFVGGLATICSRTN